MHTPTAKTCSKYDLEYFRLAAHLPVLVHNRVLWYHSNANPKISSNGLKSNMSKMFWSDTFTLSVQARKKKSSLFTKYGFQMRNQTFEPKTKKSHKAKQRERDWICKIIFRCFVGNEGIYYLLHTCFFFFVLFCVWVCLLLSSSYLCLMFHFT